MAKPWENPDHTSAGRHSLSVLRLRTRDPARVEAIRRQLSKQKGVHFVDIDLLKHVMTLEYDPDLITLHEIRTTIAGFEG